MCRSGFKDAALDLNQGPPRQVAKIKSADHVVLEAGNSPSIIFKHYRELTTEDQADKWFGIVPKEGQWENAYKWDHRARVVTLPGSAEK